MAKEIYVGNLSYQVTEDSLIVTGYGREEDRVLKLRE